MYFRLQSTRHKGRDVLLSVKIYRAIPFQSTRPAWGATSSSRRRPARPRHFNPRARVGRDGMVGRQVSTGSYFNPRAHTGRDPASISCVACVWHFNPRAHTGRDNSRHDGFRSRSNFNPRAPHGGATFCLQLTDGMPLISIHAPRMGARQGSCAALGFRRLISIHAPRMGARLGGIHAADVVRRISIHAPRMGARRVAAPSCGTSLLFQSTRPAWGRDASFGSMSSIGYNFNPRAPHGGATETPIESLEVPFISIHAPRMGARPTVCLAIPFIPRFQSTRPAWGRDCNQVIHVLLVWNFNPRAPHGGATLPLLGYLVRPSFQSTRPAWGRDIQ